MQLELEAQESVDAYWSLGVIEHFFNGYKEIAEEANRILKNKGFIFLTFPSMNILRKQKQNLDYIQSMTMKIKKIFTNLLLTLTK